MSVLSPMLSGFGRRPGSPCTQAVVAEVLSQAIVSGVHVVEALDMASTTVRGSRMRRIFGRAARAVRDGESLADSLQWAGIPLRAEFRAAMEVGDDRGGLHAELAAAARRMDPLVERHIFAAVGRGESAAQFAASLARLLGHNPLTLGLVNDAARLVGERDKRFRRMIGRLMDDIEGGADLADALSRCPKVFDQLFVQCVARADSRESLRRVLARLGGGLPAVSA